MELVVATSNDGKFAEFERLAKEWPVHLHSLKEYPRVVVPEESGATFKENALIKARAVCADLQLPVLADDSGLVVPALNGAPGIHSARYAGPTATAAENIDKLLAEMKGKIPKEREACFFCVLALVLPDGREWFISGQCDGQIAEAPSGSRGFGYDPVFWIREYDLTMAQLSPGLKDVISHRGKAMRQIAPVILDLARESAS
jgi:XTP/dITP diphosphohydrolase